MARAPSPGHHIWLEIRRRGLVACARASVGGNVRTDSSHSRRKLEELESRRGTVARPLIATRSSSDQPSPKSPPHPSRPADPPLPPRSLGAQVPTLRCYICAVLKRAYKDTDASPAVGPQRRNFSFFRTLCTCSVGLFSNKMGWDRIWVDSRVETMRVLRVAATTPRCPAGTPTATSPCAALFLSRSHNLSSPKPPSMALRTYQTSLSVGRHASWLNTLMKTRSWMNHTQSLAAAHRPFSLEAVVGASPQSSLPEYRLRTRWFGLVVLRHWYNADAEVHRGQIAAT
ncbi:hypothetical protein FA95DRAFT_1394608 [Auriscalpium vulgare]|uniref:Uncharacterized protein n=1 Tax=Auriscalpium vulgare TaxID=40419 RepID=A0ACB8RRF6_9AGAM|nr:hypothetical protein FA95DRAFT_1394608 [Auriscalpium vulgare]